MPEARESRLLANGLGHHVIHWGEGGSKTPVVLCHGFLDLAWGFRDVAEALARAGHPVFAFDWRGHGETDWVGPGGYYHFPDYVLDLHALLPQLTAQPVHLVGHSMGGSACSMFAAAQPERLQSLTLMEGMGPPAGPPTPDPQRLRLWLSAVDAVRDTPQQPMTDLDEALGRVRRRTPDLPDTLGRFLIEKATRPGPNGRGRLWRWDPLHRTPSAYGFDVKRFSQHLEAIEAPTLCIVGSRGMRTGDDAERYALLRDARKREIDDAGHMLQWTHPGEVSEALLAFFESL